MDIIISRRFEGKENRVFVGEMSEDKAINLASRFVSEGFVYGTAILLLIWEQKRKRDEDVVKKAKAEDERQRINELHRRHLQTEEELKLSQQDLKRILGEISARLEALERNAIVSPKKRGWVVPFL